MGAEADFRYFLPSLLELAATGELEWPDRPWVVRRLRMVPWHARWSLQEQNAVRAYLRAWWSDTTTENVETEDLDEVLATLSLVDTLEEFPHYLHSWLESGRTGRSRLARFITDHSMQLALGKHWNTWASREAVPVLNHWLHSGIPLQALLKEFEQDPDAPEAEQFLEAAALLESR
ncbi:hypothetical protein ACFSC4_29375 [Deinococcus malanensis]|uniref:hypothetical protein n=1 Tax=Deinococcus malanensis TaxID=1706855 RepID=UPI0036396A12